MHQLQAILTKRNQWIVAGGVLLFFCLVIWLLSSSPKTENGWEVEGLSTEVVEEKVEAVETTVQPMMADIKGAVKQPGAYRFQEGDRVADLIEEAGGFLKKADRNKVNLAALLKDEMVIYVPKVGEKLETGIAGEGDEIPSDTKPSSTSTSAGQVDLNTATLEQLQTLKGVGPSKAEAILAKRDELGGFKKVEDLKQVTGIGSKTFENLKDQVCVN